MHTDETINVKPNTSGKRTSNEFLYYICWHKSTNRFMDLYMLDIVVTRRPFEYVTCTGADPSLLEWLLWACKGFLMICEQYG